VCLGSPAQAVARAETFLGYYFLLGPTRSQAKLVEVIRAMGVKIAPGTIEEYSRSYNWVERVIELEKKLGDPIASAIIDTKETMSLKQAELGRAMQDIARRKLALMTDDNSPIEVGANDVVRLAEVGQKIERLAVGEVTERREIVTSVVNNVVQPFCDLFIQINVIPSEQERLHRFAEGADRIIDGYAVTAVESQ